MSTKKKVLTEEDWSKVREIADVHSIQMSTKGMIYLICPKTSLSPQELAMIQALYSRDPASILYHLLEVATKGAENFMKQFYVAYGHKSIGDCGNILIAYEGISMLAAKAIQDSQLYAGQEASTRYMDFSDQGFLSPNAEMGDIPLLISTSHADDHSKAQVVQERWREFYMKNMPLVLEHVKANHPYEQYAGENTEVVWEKTMKARAFDIMRGFLPAGATTCVAWWTSISHCGDHLSWLRCHILPEVSELALKTEEVLKRVYPSSFNRDVYPEREEYKKFWYQNYYLQWEGSTGSDFYVRLNCDQSEVRFYRQYIMDRPKGVELPWQIGEAFHVQWQDTIDFGSFRDLQRHRAVIQRMGLLSARFGFHDWYLENLPQSIREETTTFIAQQLADIKLLGFEDTDAQYLYPMGMKVPTSVTGSLSKFFYLIELRCQRTVHPTLHANAYRLGQLLRRDLADHLLCEPEEIPLYIDINVGELTIKRGTQDIVKA